MGGLEKEQKHNCLRQDSLIYTYENSERLHYSNEQSIIK